MIVYQNRRKHSLLFRAIASFVLLTFSTSSITPPRAFAQTAMLPAAVLNLPVPGTMVNLTPAFTPALIKGITLHPEDPLKFDFIIHPGDNQLEGEAFEGESQKLIKYFLASLTVPEDEMWVNLSPQEKNRIIPASFGLTEMGRDLLSQDYMLKQLAATLTNPQHQLGQEFLDKTRSGAAAAAI